MARRVNEPVPLSQAMRNRIQSGLMQQLSEAFGPQQQQMDEEWYSPLIRGAGAGLSSGFGVLAENYAQQAQQEQQKLSEDELMGLGLEPEVAAEVAQYSPQAQRLKLEQLRAQYQVQGGQTPPPGVSVQDVQKMRQMSEVERKNLAKENAPFLKEVRKDIADARKAVKDKNLVLDLLAKGKVGTGGWYTALEKLPLPWVKDVGKSLRNKETQIVDKILRQEMQNQMRSLGGKPSAQLLNMMERGFPTLNMQKGAIQTLVNLSKLDEEQKLEAYNLLQERKQNGMYPPDAEGVYFDIMDEIQPKYDQMREQVIQEVPSTGNESYIKEGMIDTANLPAKKAVRDKVTGEIVFIS